MNIRTYFWMRLFSSALGNFQTFATANCDTTEEGRAKFNIDSLFIRRKCVLSCFVYSLAEMAWFSLFAFKWEFDVFHQPNWITINSICFFLLFIFEFCWSKNCLCSLPSIFSHTIYCILSLWLADTYTQIAQQKQQITCMVCFCIEMNI